MVPRRAIEDVASSVPVTADTVPAGRIDSANLHRSRIQGQGRLRRVEPPRVTGETMMTKGRV